MAIESTPSGPRDTHAERACLAAGLIHAPWWWELRHVIGPDDFSHAAHRWIASALDELGDVGPFVPREGDDLAVLGDWWPSSRTVRAWAVATFAAHADVTPGKLMGLAQWADGRHEEAAVVVRDLAVQRAEIEALRYRLEDLQK